MNQFIEFSPCSQERLKALQGVFAEFKADKDANRWRSIDELLKLFDAESLCRFYWLLDDERRQRIEDLQNCPVLITPTDQAAGQTWDFDSLIDAFVNGEYELIRCEMFDRDQARLEFYALAYPYGGVGCMVALIEAFGGIITGIEDGTGFISVSRPKS